VQEMPPDGAWVPNGWLRDACMQQQKPHVVQISPLETNEMAGNIFLAAPGAISRRNAHEQDLPLRAKGKTTNKIGSRTR